MVHFLYMKETPSQLVQMDITYSALKSPTPGMNQQNKPEKAHLSSN